MVDERHVICLSIEIIKKSQQRAIEAKEEKNKRKKSLSHEIDDILTLAETGNGDIFSARSVRGILRIPHDK